MTGIPSSCWTRRASARRSMARTQSRKATRVEVLRRGAPARSLFLLDFNLWRGACMDERVS